MIDWDGLERDLVAAYAAKVKALRRRFEAELASVEAEGRDALEAAEGAAREKKASMEDTGAIKALALAGGGMPERPSFEAPTVVPATRRMVAPARTGDAAAGATSAHGGSSGGGGQGGGHGGGGHGGGGHGGAGADPWGEPAGTATSRDSAPSASERTSTSAATPAAPPPSGAGVSGATPTHATLSALPGIGALLARLDPPLPEEMTGFLGLAGEAFSRMAPEDQAGERGTKLLTDCIRLLDALAQDLELVPGGTSARETAERVAGSLTGLCERDRGCTFFPTRSLTIAEARRRYGDGAVESLALPSAEPQGTPIRTIERGLVQGGKPRRRARCLESAGREHALGSRYLEARGLLARLPAEVPVPARAEAARTLEKLAHESLSLGTDDARTLSLRYALNALVPLDRARTLAPVIEALKADLRKLGVEELDVRLGDRFGESYPPDKYERRTVSSNRAPGTISQIFQPGFTNRDGICIQRAIVGVSG